MGYACPVCEDPQADAEHLANHLAFTALLGETDHEAWLDEHAPDWEETDPESLAALVTEHAEETDYPQVFEDTTGDHDHEHGRDPEAERSGALFDDEPAFAGQARERAERDRDLDGEASEILDEAQEMTRQLLDRDADATADADDSETE